MLLSATPSFASPAPGFGAFVFASRRNRLLLAGALFVAIMKMVVFKHFFPYIDFTSDTGSYMETALQNRNYNLWPIGYSKFLWLFHQFSRSETALAIVQFVLLETSAFFFYFSVCYIYQPQSYFRYGFYAFLLINPLFPFLSNYFISDALFLSLGLTWITLLLWILYKPATWLLLVHGVLLGYAFTVRYNAMFYPLVALLPIMLSACRPWQKILAILLPVVLIASFVVFTRQKTAEHSGTKIFSAFSGWQMMNNAMYMMQYQHLDSTGAPAPFTRLHKQTYYYLTALKAGPRKIIPSDGSYFMWDMNGPQKQLMGEYAQQHRGMDVYAAWCGVATLYDNYGKYMIAQHPWDFTRYYLLGNAKLYFLPELEVLGGFNRPIINLVNKDVGTFFRDGEKPKPAGKYGELQATLMSLFPSLIVICHLLFLEETIRYLLKKGIRKTRRKFNIALLLCWTFIGLNFAFSVFAAPIVLRYQVLLIVLLLGYTLLLTEITDAPAISEEEAAREEEHLVLGI
ncbi:hypothetical protein [Chitinophaga arvensicola]|uniref:Dolichyl-phosphate-mannose-protein mannosyltransferase n=1 Tax=Chitinophaga arvensicola TaxID=29529 RepID=A0A1I0SCQ3_9BACT|nr:hypothetical protein [Chitinophaga arvensicola]SEW55018.1 hypothetical protein SAMN04488122_6280 [Chitinophaga arvensicola]